ncbi:hypothetical protein B0H16DRAFT_1461213 [Mycena metata]|uniref:Uncharacterized protein n=1 Tax=Mycena metata TaxID=1033252 RepID=A0AAD7N8T2_9AGAR|nr:hypothetical protein B0H16DRAFT_1461213 [Mycena metata]
MKETCWLTPSIDFKRLSLTKVARRGDAEHLPVGITTQPTGLLFPDLTACSIPPARAKKKAFFMALPRVIELGDNAQLGEVSDLRWSPKERIIPGVEWNFGVTLQEESALLEDHLQALFQPINHQWSQEEQWLRRRPQPNTATHRQYGAMIRTLINHRHGTAVPDMPPLAAAGNARTLTVVAAGDVRDQFIKIERLSPQNQEMVAKVVRGHFKIVRSNLVRGSHNLRFLSLHSKSSQRQYRRRGSNFSKFRGFHLFERISHISLISAPFDLLWVHSLNSLMLCTKCMGSFLQLGAERKLRLAKCYSVFRCNRKHKWVQGIGVLCLLDEQRSGLGRVLPRFLATIYAEYMPKALYTSVNIQLSTLSRLDPPQSHFEMIRQ